MGGSLTTLGEVTLALTCNEKSSGIYIKTNRTNQSYTCFDAQVPILAHFDFPFSAMCERMGTVDSKMCTDNWFGAYIHT